MLNAIKNKLKNQMENFIEKNKRLKDEIINIKYDINCNCNWGRSINLMDINSNNSISCTKINQIFLIHFSQQLLLVFWVHDWKVLLVLQMQDGEAFS